MEKELFFDNRVRPYNPSLARMRNPRRKYNRQQAVMLLRLNRPPIP